MGILFLKGIGMGLLVSAPLGPVGVMCIQRTINRGIKSGLASGLGAAAADLFYALIAGFGLSIIIDFIEARHTTLQIIGSVLVVAVAFKIFYSNPAAQLRNQRNKKGKYLEDFISIFVVTVSNPAVFVAFVAMFSGFKVLDSATGHTGTIVAIIGIFTGSMLWWYILSAGINHFRTKIRLRNLWWMNKIMGVIVFVCGIVALIDAMLRFF